MPGVTQAKKDAYFVRVVELFDKYPRVLVVYADNVGSAHMQSIRKNLRGKGIVLMGKNTLIRKALKGHLDKNPSLSAILPQIKGNVGFIFTDGDLNVVREEILKNRVSAPARVGAIAPQTVIVPAGPTGLDPQQTAFMQALNIATRINRGQVEIINDVELLKEGERVGSSESTLLTKLNIRPFSYGLKVKSVFDAGFVYDVSVLDIKDEDILSQFKVGIRNIAALSLAIHYPTVCAIPHYFARAYKNLLSIALVTEVKVTGADKLKELLENPEALAAATAAASATSAPAASTAAAAAPKEEEKKEEPEEEAVDEDFGGLFGDD